MTDKPATPGCVLTDEQIMRAAVNAADALDATRVSEMRAGGWHATTIFDGDSGLLRLGRLVEKAVLSSAQSAGTRIAVTPQGHDEAQELIAAHVQQIQIIADAFGYDPFQWLADEETPRSASERIVWPKAKLVGRMGEMAPPGEMTLVVALQDDGDVVVEVHEKRYGEYNHAQAEFCTIGPGGGKSPRTREAIIALMVAIEADNAASSYRAWPPKKDRVTDSVPDRKANG